MLARVAVLAALLIVAVGALSGGGILDRLASIAAPEAVQPPASSRAPIVLVADPSGHYFVDASVGAKPVRFVVDTGATTVALSAETAKRIGVMPSERAFTGASRTANGIVAVAPIRLAEIRIGGMRVSGVDAVVMPPGALSVDLLGMSFLGRLSGIRVSGQRMVLTP